MDSIAPYISEERDALYLRGQEKGQEQEQTKFVANLLRNQSLQLTVAQIAEIADVSIDFVETVRQKRLSGE